jgi:tRNA pseudouridine32 synthase / 23S rRNA pseudouridine746 synthase
MNPRADQGLTAAQKIHASAARTRASYQDQVLSAVKDCPLRGGGETVPAHGGNCVACREANPPKLSHSILRSAEAEAEAQAFYQEIRANGHLGGVPVADLDTRKGNMIGVLLCIDDAGNTRVLRAFSNFVDESNVSYVPGCSPAIPPADPAEISRLQNELAAAQAGLPALQQAATATRTALNAAEQPHIAALNDLQRQITAVYRNRALLPDQRQTQLQPLMDQKAAIEGHYAAEKTAADLARRNLQDAERNINDLRAEITERNYGGRTLTNFKNESKTIRQACTEAARADDGRTGNCAAPKMIAEAQRNGWTPVAIAELWIGGDLGTQRDFGLNNNFVPSCECCRAILGFALCGIEEKQRARRTELEAQATARAAPGSQS